MALSRGQGRAGGLLRSWMSLMNHARRHGSRIVHHLAMHRVWGVGRDPERRGGGD